MPTHLTQQNTINVQLTKPKFFEKINNFLFIYLYLCQNKQNSSTKHYLKQVSNVNKQKNMSNQANKIEKLIHFLTCLIQVNKKTLSYHNLEV